MKLKDWILGQLDDQEGGLWSLYEIDSVKGIFRDTAFGPMWNKIPADVELTEEEKTLHIKGFKQCVEWLDKD